MRPIKVNNKFDINSRKRRVNRPMVRAGGNSGYSRFIQPAFALDSHPCSQSVAKWPDGGKHGGQWRNLARRATNQRCTRYATVDVSGTVASETGMWCRLTGCGFDSRALRFAQRVATPAMSRATPSTFVWLPSGRCYRKGTAWR